MRFWNMHKKLVRRNKLNNFSVHYIHCQLPNGFQLRTDSHLLYTRATPWWLRFRKRLDPCGRFPASSTPQRWGRRRCWSNRIRWRWNNTINVRTRRDQTNVPKSYVNILERNERKYMVKPDSRVFVEMLWFVALFVVKVHAVLTHLKLCAGETIVVAASLEKNILSIIILHKKKANSVRTVQCVYCIYICIYAYMHLCFHLTW